MAEDLREQVCWLLLAFESWLSTRVVNSIVVAWCHQQKRSMQEFYASDAQEWADICGLSGDITKKLEQSKEKLAGQAFLVEQLAHNNIHIMAVPNANYPKLLETSLKREQTPPILFYAGDPGILERKTIAVIGSRNAGAESLDFTRAVSAFLAEQGANVISGNARGVDRAAYEGATSGDGCTTVVLPHGIRKLSGVQIRALQPKIESGKVFLMSQFNPDAQWAVSRAMERNKVVTGLAQVVIVAESDIQGGTWEGAHVALKQQRPLYVRSSDSALAGNNQLIELGGHALPWPGADVAEILFPILKESAALQQEKQQAVPRPDQLTLFATSNE